MNAVMKPKNAPRSSASLEAELETLQRSLGLAQHNQNQLRSSGPALKAEGDEDRANSASKELALLDIKIAQIRVSIEQTEHAKRHAKERERAERNALAYAGLQKGVGDARKKVEDLGTAAKNLAIALKDARAALQTVDGQMRVAGVTPDPYVLQAKLMGILKMALHLESGGLLGEALTLDSPEQLRRSGRACLVRAAQEFHALTMQRIRSTLHINQE